MARDRGRSADRERADQGQRAHKQHRCARLNLSASLYQTRDEAVVVSLREGIFCLAWTIKESAGGFGFEIDGATYGSTRDGYGRIVTLSISVKRQRSSKE